MMLVSRLLTVTRTALKDCPLVGSKICMPDGSVRVESQTLHSTVTSAAVKVSKKLGTLANADVRPAATARVQSAAAPMLSTWTADKAARSAPFCISRFI
ncbi:hypothetical protein G6F22_021026 [Rhizopus arrhizus]|nr:hypothetical protein G6F22_021026 [Rhizopus arrhizus]